MADLAPAPAANSAVAGVSSVPATGAGAGEVRVLVDTQCWRNRARFWGCRVGAGTQVLDMSLAIKANMDDLPPFSEFQAPAAMLPAEEDNKGPLPWTGTAQSAADEDLEPVRDLRREAAVALMMLQGDGELDSAGEEEMGEEGQADNE
ncbi:hypothetical protein B484DRAFT_408228 [Ochromonadaceae sp. CCMP2298]|nr:hypothetical protein B484DRAFT_408228 [Ochromonadaceae sp. CCMP2298]